MGFSSPISGCRCEIYGLGRRLGRIFGAICANSHAFRRSLRSAVLSSVSCCLMSARPVSDEKGDTFSQLHRPVWCGGALKCGHSFQCLDLNIFSSIGNFPYDVAERLGAQC